MNRLLIIGATGRVGRQVIAQLPTAGVSIRALVRTPDIADLPGHVEVIQGDLTQPESLDACLEGIDTVFLVWMAPPATISAAMQRIAKPRRRVVFLSAPIKTPHPLFQQPGLARKIPEEIESLIEASGCEWTFLRPGMFASNAKLWWAQQFRAGGPIRWAYLDVPTAPIDERDIASVGVRALTEDGHHQAEYVLTGPESLTHREQIATIGDVLGRALRIEQMSPSEAPSELLEFIPAPVAVKMLLDAWAAAVDQPALLTSTVTEITGSPARTFRNWAQDHIADFRS